MYRHTRSMESVEVKRSYMKAIRDLLGLGQYTVVRMMKDERVIRESEVSVIEGKIGYKYLWKTYADFYRPLIESSEHCDAVKNVMRTLLRTWEEAE